MNLFDHGSNLIVQGVLQGSGSSAASGSAGDVATRIRAIRQDKNHAYNQPRSAAHDAAVREVAELYTRLPLPETTGLDDTLDIAV